jgi:hypothetical protein
MLREPANLMNKSFLLCLVLMTRSPAFSQQDEATASLLQKLDSVQGSPSISRHFASLYLKVTVKAAWHYSGAKKDIQQLMSRFEVRFAGYFFMATEAYEKKEEIPAAWKTYYSDSNRSKLQYFLLGANAHINGDIWKTLTNEFSPDELKKFRTPYYRFNRKLKEELLFVHGTVLALFLVPVFARPFIRLNRHYAKWMFQHWRNDSLNFHCFGHRQKFTVKLNALQKKGCY